MTAYLARHSLQGVYLTKDNEKFYSECLEKLLLLKESIDVTDRWFLRCTKEAVAHMHEAGQVLYTAVHRWIVSILARSATADVVATQPEYILLRSNSADSWDIRKYRYFVYHHVKAGKIAGMFSIVLVWDGACPFTFGLWRLGMAKV